MHPLNTVHNTPSRYCLSHLLNTYHTLSMSPPLLNTAHNTPSQYVTPPPLPPRLYTCRTLSISMSPPPPSLSLSLHKPVATCRDYKGLGQDPDDTGTMGCYDDDGDDLDRLIVLERRRLGVSRGRYLFKSNPVLS